jgi:hypothetical protein
MTLALVPSGASETEFIAVFNRLCVALREPQDDTGITQGVYWDALRDLPVAALETGAQTLMRQQGRRFFPTTAEWRAAAEQAHAASLRQVVSMGGRSEPWKHECHDCEDTGWIIGLTCDGGTTCGRTRKHQAHDYTQACPCRPTNRTYRRHLMMGGGAA